MQTVGFLVLLSFALLWDPFDPISTPDALYRPLRDVPGLFQRSYLDRGGIKHLGMDQWPNRIGPLKTGFRFVPSDYPQLNGCRMHGDGQDFSREDLRKRYRYWFESGSSSVIIEIDVFLRSNAEAQQGLVDRMRNTSFPIDPLLRTGRRYGPVLGDVCLTAYAPFLSSPPDWPQVDFVRNNIRVSIDAYSGFPAFALAQAIDERIRRSE